MADLVEVEVLAEEEAGGRGRGRSRSVGRRGTGREGRGRVVNEGRGQGRSGRKGDTSNGADGGGSGRRCPPRRHRILGSDDDTNNRRRTRSMALESTMTSNATPAAAAAPTSIRANKNSHDFSSTVKELIEQYCSCEGNRDKTIRSIMAACMAQVTKGSSFPRDQALFILSGGKLKRCSYSSTSRCSVTNVEL